MPLAPNLPPHPPLSAKADISPARGERGAKRQVLGIKPDISDVAFFYPPRWLLYLLPFGSGPLPGLILFALVGRRILVAAPFRSSDKAAPAT